MNGWYHQDDGRGADNGDAWSIGADLAVLWEGFHLGAEIHRRETDRATSAAPPNDMELTGYHAQLGYMLEGIDWRAPQQTWRPEIAG